MCHRTKIHTRNVWAKNCFFKVAVNWFSSLFFGFGLRRLLSATETTKNQKTSNKNQKKTKKTKDSEECLGQGLCSEALVFLFFWFSSSFFGFGLRRLLSAIETTKNQKTSNKNKKKQKNQRILRNVWAKDFVQRHWFFCFFWFSSSFFGFGLRKLLSATKTTKNSKTSKKTKKLKKTKKPKDSEECLGQGLCSEALVFLFFLVFLEFFWFWAPEAFIGY